MYVFLLYTNYLNALSSELCLISPILKALKREKTNLFTKSQQTLKIKD